jgi:hypothetical protein
MPLHFPKKRAVKAVLLLAGQRAKVGDIGLSDFFVRWMQP